MLFGKTSQPSSMHPARVWSFVAFVLFGTSNPHTHTLLPVEVLWARDGGNSIKSRRGVHAARLPGRTIMTKYVPTGFGAMWPNAIWSFLQSKLEPHPGWPQSFSGHRISGPCTFSNLGIVSRCHACAHTRTKRHTSLLQFLTATVGSERRMQTKTCSCCVLCVRC